MRRFDPQAYLDHQRRELSRLQAEVISLGHEIVKLEQSLPGDLVIARHLIDDNLCPECQTSRYTCIHSIP